MKISDISGELYSYHGYQYPQHWPEWAMQSCTLEDGQTLAAIVSKAKTQSGLKRTLKRYGLFIDPTYRELQAVNRKAMAEFEAEHAGDGVYKEIRCQMYESRLRGNIEKFKPRRPDKQAGEV